MNYFFIRSLNKLAACAGSFTAVASEFFITHLAISQHIKALEYEFGVNLFARQGKVVMLTDEGRGVQKFVYAMLRVMDKAKKCIQ